VAVTRFTDLRVWQASRQITLNVYRISRAFPADERFGLAIQMRRAAVSIGSNIAEGFGRRGPKDKARIYNIAEGSAEELKNLLLVTRDLEFFRRSGRDLRRARGRVPHASPARRHDLGRRRP
jgi:four helix bundle protein